MTELLLVYRPSSVWKNILQLMQKMNSRQEDTRSTDPKFIAVPLQRKFISLLSRHLFKICLLVSTLAVYPRSVA
jgi:hypothetical protein